MSTPSSSIQTRICAALAVMDILTQQEALETALSKQPAYMALEPRDRAFARLIAATSFRRMGQIDSALKPYMNKTPIAEVHAILRTATAQLLFLDTPPHAAVGESVGAVRALGRDGFANMTNAILRRVADEGGAKAKAQPPKINLPGWLRGTWEREYGAQAMRRIAAQLAKEPPLDISVKSDPEGWAKRLGAEILPTGTLRLPQIGDITALEGFAEGEWWAQDVAASLPVKMMDITPGMRVLDLCAAPGGKTMQLCALGAEVTALDISETRVKRLRANLERTKYNADIIVADARDWTPDTLFDAVLLDAPCSATGTMRRHPDVLYNKTPKVVGNLVRIQRRLAHRAASFVRPGGQLLYAVCSLQPEEGEHQLTRLLGELSDFRLNPTLTTLVSKLPNGIVSDGCLRSMPHHLGVQGGMDGFFAARLERTMG